MLVQQPLHADPTSFPTAPARSRDGAPRASFEDALRSQSEATASSGGEQPESSAPVQDESAPAEAQPKPDRAQESRPEDASEHRPDKEIEGDDAAERRSEASDSQPEAQAEPAGSHPESTRSVAPSPSNDTARQDTDAAKPPRADHAQASEEPLRPLERVPSEPASRAADRPSQPAPEASEQDQQSPRRAPTPREAVQQPVSAAADERPPRQSDAANRHKPDTLGATDADDPAAGDRAVRVRPIETLQPSGDGSWRADARASTFAQRLTAEGAQHAQDNTPIDERVFNASVTRGLEAALRQKGGSVSIRLKPESLGALRIEMTIDQGSVTARLEAATQQAQELLNKNLATLRNALEGKGLVVRSVDVQIAPSGQTSSASDQTGQQTSGSFQDHHASHSAGDGGQSQAHGRREDPDGVGGTDESFDPLAEAEGIGESWRPIFINGSLNTVA